MGAALNQHRYELLTGCEVGCSRLPHGLFTPDQLARFRRVGAQPALVFGTGDDAQAGAMRESISISLPKELKKEMDRYSESQGVSRSDMVREALRDYLFVQRFRALRRELMVYAEAQGVFTDEDVFRKIS
jgi:Arc/MetJ-type ribon-helix-helix transcriptional regulator